ncbi:protein BREAST CANCER SUSCEPTIBILITY 1 homolog [Trifolium pratense]|uniref:protein BREAST CANCER SUSCEPTIBILITY 1 homolog n=1 Tax=Trifolium pratense TaxID=57577 RepID=UPI001E694F9E|nr:protein BREAST CANCER SUSCEPTIBILITY 1 homolog [Trifolium pratense]
MENLERMGRELKCPICLGLIHSAVSLTCNHLFCNSCIIKSMKSAFSCPVCKIPFARREIRPAPQIDSLVTIYKNMEAASAINLFGTQNPPATKSPDEDKQCKGDYKSGEKGTGGTHENHPEEEITPKRKKLAKKLQASTKSSASNRAEPSFPAKKRVQVPQDILSETPMRNLKSGGSVSLINKEGTQKASTKGNKMEIQSEKGDQVKEPFFWLREEKDGEMLSQQSSEDLIIEGSSPVLPSFSDLQDANDDSPSKQAPSDEVQNKPSFDLFDSEMFEWTQKPCSPELFSSPIKMQVEDTFENDENIEELVAGTQEHQLSADAYNINFENPVGNQLADVLPQGVSSQISSDDLNGKKKTTKRSRKAREKSKEDKIWEQKCQNDEMNLDSNIKSKDIEDQSLDNKHRASNLKKSNRKGKKVSFIISTDSTPQTACTVSNISGVQSKGRRMTAKNLYTSASKQDNEIQCSQKIAGKSQVRRSGNQRLDVVHEPPEDLTSVQNQCKELARSASSTLGLQMDDNRKDANIGKRKSSLSRNSMLCSKERKSAKKPKISTEFISRTKNDEEIKSNESVKQGTDVRPLNDSSKEKQCNLTDQPVLKKCVNHVKDYQCAFCLSSEESEASGPMVHYFDGKPVTADYERGSKVIHCHRNCTEWAPNVYFEDDNAINLEAEISRSRRIKCSFCGLKGAALGCFEKSCRRSFHVPCAKWTPECRWDMENFVMLCPVHSSSMLPYESSGSQHRSKILTASKVKSCSRKHDTTSQSRVTHGSHKKIVLCCSALSVQERDVVSDFERVSKVTVLKTWDSSVTHVIASTDENGACRRTLKVLLGILEGKWILSIEWIKACMKDTGPVDEERYELNVDIHGIRDGPRLGRQRALNKQPKLFDGYKFYFMGDFIPSYKGYLQDLVIAAGGTVLHRKPVSGDHQAIPPDMHPHQTLIIYSLELPAKCNPLEKDAIFSQRRCDAEVLARPAGSKVASNTWILNSIAGCKLQSLPQ